MTFVFKGKTKEEVEAKAAEMRKGIEINGKFDYFMDIRRITTGTGLYWKATLHIFFKEYTWEH